MTEAISINKVYEKLKDIEQNMLTEQKLVEYLETFEVISNPHTMESIRNSREDIKHGRVKKISGVKDLLSEL